MNVQQEKILALNVMWGMKAIKGTPIYSLRGCLQSYSERMVYNLEEKLDVEETKGGESKGERIKRLNSAIQQDMRQQLLYLTKRQAYFLIECAQKKYIDNLSDAYGMETVFSLIDVGWIYCFVMGDEACFVLPEELKKIVEDTFFEGDNFIKQQKYYELSEYIEAFVHLYGAFESRHLLDVWNQHHPDDAFMLEQLEQYVKRASGRQSVFESAGDLIYSDQVFSVEIAESLMNSVSIMPYYIPHPDEIWALAYKSAQDTVQFQQLEKYVRRWNLSQAEQILAAVWDYVRIGISADEVTEELVAEGLLDSTNTTFINKFNFYYKKLLNDSRNWQCRGHKLYEIKRILIQQQQNISAGTVIQFPVGEGE
ncbi:hypothetical protein JTF06_08140 [Desemzia sp. RIT804]|uniref:hypothetical protein n=1 Tax=Desemzia sp. RIT 804 TaxID=2810209 RepID=UPI0019514C84|nr:hypothetical protein [Desemzia sp. RIT 804]MBM6614860.1 hypothetical protein [Desemzia sp. RIT 804]